MSDLYFLIFGIVVAVTGLLFIIAKIAQAVSCREKITAVISSFKTEKTVIRGSTVHSYRPEFTYSFDGKEYSGTAPFTSLKNDKYPVGDSLKIYINKSKPEEYRFKGRIGGYIAGTVFLAVGLLFVVLYFI